MKLTPIVGAVMLLAAGAAHAGVALLDSSMYPTLIGSNGGTIGGVTFGTDAGKTFTLKTKAGFSGLGVSGGRTNDEIDIGETISIHWASGRVIGSFAVAVFYNGPEFGDWAERARVTARDGDAIVGTGYLEVDATNDMLAYFSGTGFGSVSNLSAANQSGGGAWLVSNPFGTAKVTSLQFTALESGLCGTQTRCTNQSDYTLSSVNAVPEPGSLALALAGMGVAGLTVRRRARA